MSLNRERFPLKNTLVSFGAAVMMTAEVFAAGVVLSWSPDYTKGDQGIVTIDKTCVLSGRFPRVVLNKNPYFWEPAEGLTLVVPADESYYDQGKLPRQLHYDWSSLDPKFASALSVDAALKIKIYRGNVTGLVPSQERANRALYETSISKCP